MCNISWSSGFQVLANVATIAALGFAAYQMSDAKDAIRASTQYTIAKDGRELGRQIAEGEAGMGDVMNFVHAVYHQHRLGVIDLRTWNPVVAETCAYIGSKQQEFGNYWTPDTKPFFDAGFVALIDRIKGGDCK